MARLMGVCVAGMEWRQVQKETGTPGQVELRQEDKRSEP